MTLALTLTLTLTLTGCSGHAALPDIYGARRDGSLWVVRTAPLGGQLELGVQLALGSG